MLKRLIEKPIAVTMTVIAVMILGVVASGLLPVSLMPDVPIPHVTVSVSSPGLSSRQIDAQVIAPLRNQLMQVGHLREIRTESRDGAANIFLQFEYGADIDFLFIEVNEKVDRAMNSLPREMERPRVIKASATDIPAFYLNIGLEKEDAPDSGSASTGFMELSSLVTQVISKRIEQIPQVAIVDISGTVFPEILIVPNKEKVEALGIGLTEIETAIRNNNIDLGNLSIRDGEYRYNIRFGNSLTSADDIRALYLKIDGRVYRLEELAEVFERPQPRKGIVRADGQDILTLAVIKQSDARMKDLKKEMARLLENMRRDYPDLRFDISRDQTQLLEYSIGNLRNNIILAGFLACVVLLVFMGDFRSPALVSITIPLSLIVSLLLFHLVGITINVISLSGLILCVGMMVDNSIIVIDNISQYRSRGLPQREAIVRGAGEVFTPMLSSVLTTISVFVPLIFLSGIAGALFYDQAMAVSIGLLVSLVVSVLILPVYYRLFYRKGDIMIKNRFLLRIDVSGRMTAGYEKALKWVFRRRGWVWTAMLLTVPIGFFIFRGIDRELFPEMTRDDVLLHIDWNEMVSVEENVRRVNRVLEGISPWASRVTVMAGNQEFLLSHMDELSPSESVVYIQGKTPDDISRIEKYISAFMADHYAEATCGFKASGNIFDMVFSQSEAPLVARLRQKDGKAPSPDKLNALLSVMAERISGVRFEPVLWNEYVMLIADPERMALYHVDYHSLFSELKNVLNQNTLFTINNGAIPVPVLSGENRTDTDLLRGSILNRDSVFIPFRTLLVETRSRDLKSIVSGNEGNYYPLSVYAVDRDIPRMMEEIRNSVAQDGLYEVDFTGSYFTNRSMIFELIRVLVIALLLLYFILAAQFESIVQPLIILSEVFIDICGALILLYLCGQSVNLMSLIGIVVMCGIVINDSILKVDTINQLRKEGYSLLKAIMTGGVRRLKPIVMTSLTTILALVPFLNRGSMGADLQYPLSLALIGGMVVGTLVSIFFVPLVYYQIYKRKG